MEVHTQSRVIEERPIYAPAAPRAAWPDHQLLSRPMVPSRGRYAMFFAYLVALAQVPGIRCGTRSLFQALFSGAACLVSLAMVMTLGGNLKLRLRRRVFVITLGLLIAQLGMLAHALEHERELAQARTHAACLLCHAADHLGQGLPSPYALATLPQSPALATEEPRIAADVETVFVFLARAPPAALQA